MPGSGMSVSCGARTSVVAVWPTIVATVEPTTIWRPMKAPSNAAPGSVSVVVAGTASAAGGPSTAGDGRLLGVRHARRRRWRRRR